MGKQQYQMPELHTHTTVLLLFWNMSVTTRVSRYQKGKTRKVKTNLDLLKQEIVSGNGICWAICMSAPHPIQTTTPTSHHSVFLQAGCPSCHPTNSVKALKGWALKGCALNSTYSWSVFLQLPLSLVLRNTCIQYSESIKVYVNV